MEDERLTWRKASRSGANGGGCVEVAEDGARMLVRDSKDVAGHMLSVDRESWRTFLASLRRA